jgi:ribulose-5-phosphate 4-epimerase/fuculose-1-phosphate aldolase
MTYLSERDARRAIVEAAETLTASGMMFRGHHANLSARIAADRIVMTRGGSVARLTSEDLAVLDLGGRVVSGEAMDPTMQEIIQMHTRVYAARDTVGAVIHTHAPHITAFAVAHKPLPLVYEPVLRFGVSEEVPVIPWAPRGSEKSVGDIVDVVTKHPGLSAVMLANHGVLVFHADPLSTAQLLTTLDEAAELAWMAQALGGARPLSAAAVDEVRERMVAFGSLR